MSKYDWLVNPDSHLTLSVSYQRKDDSGCFRTVKRATVAPGRKHRIRSLTAGDRMVILTRQVRYD